MVQDFITNNNQQDVIDDSKVYSENTLEKLEKQTYLKELQKTWDDLAKIDPLWAILSRPEKKGNKWDIEEFFATGKKEIDDVMEYIKSLGVNILRRKALDFGCGVGRLTQSLGNYFDEVIGVDIAPYMIELANIYNQHTDKCKYYLNLNNDLKVFSNNSFNFIYTTITLQHIEPQYSKNYIKEFLRVLAPHGLLIFQLPSELILNSYNYKLKKILKKLIKFITPKILLNVYLKRKAKNHNRPKYKMYGIKQKEVIEFLKENGKILNIVQDRKAGQNWISFSYYVTKE